MDWLVLLNKLSHHHFIGTTFGICTKISSYDLGGDQLKALFWAVASTCNRVDFRRAVANMKQANTNEGENMAVMEWLRKIPPKLWARAFFSDNCKSDILVNNLNESLNSYILEARDKPIITMFEWIQRRLMQ